MRTLSTHATGSATTNHASQLGCSPPMDMRLMAKMFCGLEMGEVMPPTLEAIATPITRLCGAQGVCSRALRAGDVGRGGAGAPRAWSKHHNKHGDPHAAVGSFCRPGRDAGSANARPTRCAAYTRGRRRGACAASRARWWKGRADLAERLAVDGLAAQDGLDEREAEHGRRDVRDPHAREARDKHGCEYDAGRARDAREDGRRGRLGDVVL